MLVVLFIAMTGGAIGFLGSYSPNPDDECNHADRRFITHTKYVLGVLSFFIILIGVTEMLYVSNVIHVTGFENTENSRSFIEQICEGREHD